MIKCTVFLEMPRIIVSGTLSICGHARVKYEVSMGHIMMDLRSYLLRTLPGGLIFIEHTYGGLEKNLTLYSNIFL